MQLVTGEQLSSGIGLMLTCSLACALLLHPPNSMQANRASADFHGRVGDKPQEGNFLEPLLRFSADSSDRLQALFSSLSPAARWLLGGASALAVCGTAVWLLRRRRGANKKPWLFVSDKNSTGRNRRTQHRSDSSKHNSESATSSERRC